MLELDSGKTIHLVNMTDIYGNLITAKSLAGKTLVMNFWFIGCPPCRYEIPQLSKIADDFKSEKDIVFIAISTDNVSALKEFFKTNIFNYRQVGAGNELNKLYNIQTCPLSLIINKKGTIIYNSYNQHYLAEVPGRITEILKGR